MYFLPELLTSTRARVVEAKAKAIEDARVVGINHRDLETFQVDTRRTAKLAPLIPQGVVIVAASGVSTRAEMDELAAAGADAVLVGQSLVTAADPAAKLRELSGR